LYDVVDDPGQNTNIAESEPEITSSMTVRLVDVMSKLHPPAVSETTREQERSKNEKLMRDLQDLGYMK
jgi:hypothetical protein